MRNLIERIQIWLGWKKVVIIVVDQAKGMVKNIWAKGADIYLVRNKYWDIYVDYNNQKVQVKSSKRNPRLYLD